MLLESNNQIMNHHNYQSQSLYQHQIHKHKWCNLEINQWINQKRKNTLELTRITFTTSITSLKNDWKEIEIKAKKEVMYLGMFCSDIRGVPIRKLVKYMVKVFFFSSWGTVVGATCFFHHCCETHRNTHKIRNNNKIGCSSFLSSFVS